MKKPSRKPQHISATDWYYEFPTYLLLVHEVRDKAGLYIQTDQYKLPWRLIDKSHMRRPRRRTSR